MDSLIYVLPLIIILISIIWLAINRKSLNEFNIFSLNTKGEIPNIEKNTINMMLFKELLIQQKTIFWILIGTILCTFLYILALLVKVSFIDQLDIQVLEKVGTIIGSLSLSGWAYTVYNKVTKELRDVKAQLLN